MKQLLLKNLVDLDTVLFTMDGQQPCTIKMFLLIFSKQKEPWKRKIKNNVVELHSMRFKDGKKVIEHLKAIAEEMLTTAEI